MSEFKDKIKKLASVIKEAKQVYVVGSTCPMHNIEIKKYGFKFTPCNGGNVNGTFYGKCQHYEPRKVEVTGYIEEDHDGINDVICNFV